MSLTTEYLSPPKITKLLGVGIGKVHYWIRTGQLRASNIGQGTVNPRWIVLRADLQAFLDARLVTPPPPVSRRRKRVADEEVTYY